MRNRTIDILRGLCVIFVVLGHCYFPYTKILYSFHVPLFFIISGMTEKPFCISDGVPFRVHLMKKLKRLYVPFVVFSIIELLLHNILIDLHIYATELSTSFLTDNLFFVDRYTSTEILQRLLKAFVFAGGSQLGGALWFFKVLFFCAVLFKIECVLLKKVPQRLIMISLINVTLSLIGWMLMAKGIILPLKFETVFFVMMFYNLGFCVHNYYTVCEQKISAHKICSSVVASIFLIVLYRYQNVNIGNDVVSNPLLLLLTTFSGYVLCFAISEFLSKKNISRLMCFIGTNTVSIVLLHFLAFKLVNIVVIKYNRFDLIYLASFPVLDKTMWYLYAFVGVSVPLLLSILFDFFIKKIKRLV